MVNKCVVVVFDWKTGYSTGTSNEKVSTSEFPFKRPKLLVKWIKFVKRKDLHCF